MGLLGTLQDTLGTTLWYPENDGIRQFFGPGGDGHTTLTRNRHPWPPAVFEPADPAIFRPQTHALDRAATGIDNQLILNSWKEYPTYNKKKEG
jgi:hypothetical protein